LEQAELEFSQVEASVREKQSSGLVVSEQDYQKLYELDNKLKKLRSQLEQEEAAAEKSTSTETKTKL
ncbi:MAG TPA: hypothetical protein DD473_20930, partial [Planctomycetaceae bacterium]|nr:hypothetical protein [Planctomycetaceae bacterium]